MARNPIRAPRLWGQAAQRRADDEDSEAVDVEELPAPHVGEPAHGGHRGHQDKEIAQSHPGHRADAGMERPLQRGQGDGHDAGVELPHEGPDADGSHGQPEGVRSLTDRARDASARRPGGAIRPAQPLRVCPCAPIVHVVPIKIENRYLLSDR